MGIASKLAAVQAAQGALNAYSGGAGATGPRPGQMPYPGQPGQAPQHQSAHGAPSYGQPPQQQQQQQQHGYGGYAAAGAAGAAAGAAGAAAGAYGAQQGYGQTPQLGGPPQPNYGQYPQSQQGQGQYGGYQQQQQYGAPHDAPQGQYGAPQGYPQGQSYGAPPQGQYGQPGAYGSAPGQGEVQMITEILDHCVRDQHLQAFYPPGSTMQIAQRVAQSGALNRLAQEWRLPKEVAFDCVKIALFDVILLLDDSGSMRFDEQGTRIEDAKVVLGRIAFSCSLFDGDGISVRFLNSQERGDNLTNEQQAAQLIQRIQFSGLTPLGTAMQDKILSPLVLQPARAGQLRKPVLIISITDGQPAGEPKFQIATAIANARNELRNSRYGPDAMSFQFAQVGNDMAASQFLQELDANPDIGSLIDCTSNYEIEADQAKKTSGVDLSPELWLVKLLLGPIDSSYDSKDESRR